MISLTQDVLEGTKKKTPARPRKRGVIPVTGLKATELADLRAKINNEEYLHEAIQRIALILSNELLDIPQGGWNYEQQRKGRR
jgi:hypothetical protein